MQMQSEYMALTLCCGPMSWSRLMPCGLSHVCTLHSIKAAAEKRRQEQMAKVKTEKKKAAVRQTDLGSFEAHTKGAAAGAGLNSLYVCG